MIQIAFRVFRLALVFDKKAPSPLDPWTFDGYTELFVLNSTASIAYYVAALHTCFVFGNPALYKPPKGNALT
jgi:hypothetical protein